MNTTQLPLRSSEAIRRICHRRRLIVAAIILGVGALAACLYFLLRGRFGVETAFAAACSGAAWFILSIIGCLIAEHRIISADELIVKDLAEAAKTHLHQKRSYFAEVLSSQDNYGRGDNNKNKLFVSEPAREVVAVFYDSKGYAARIQEWGFDEIERIAIRHKPDELNIPGALSSKFTIAGTLLGGIPGLALGSLIDNSATAKGMQTKDVRFVLEFTFHLRDGTHQSFKTTDTPLPIGPDMSEVITNELRAVTGRMADYHAAVARLFPDRIEK